jgi:hypothetical protein
MADIDVLLKSRKARYAYGESLLLTYSVTNVSTADVYVVNDTEAVHVLRADEHHVRVVVGQVAPLIDLDYFAFQPPRVRRLAPGGRFSARLMVGMPPVDTEVTSDGRAVLADRDVEGSVEVVVEVGYGRGPFQALTLDPLGEFLAWQQLQASAPVGVEVAARGPIEPAA